MRSPDPRAIAIDARASMADASPGQVAKVPLQFEALARVPSASAGSPR